MKRKANRWWPGWNATLVGLPDDVLISESKSRTYDGLWLMEPKQFLFDAMPRAQRYLERFPAPPNAHESPPAPDTSGRRTSGSAEERAAADRTGMAILRGAEYFSGRPGGWAGCSASGGSWDGR
jgi:hypothetical protein